MFDPDDLDDADDFCTMFGVSDTERVAEQISIIRRNEIEKPYDFDAQAMAATLRWVLRSVAVELIGRRPQDRNVGAF